MNNYKRFMYVVLSFLLIISVIFPVTATASGLEETDVSEKTGKISGKDEVIYGVLEATGEEKEFYVVNRLTVLEKGRVIDYGKYHSLKNLTNLAEMEQTADQVEVVAEEGTFYYQGNLDAIDLPWKFAIRYSLDGKRISPEELAGESGKLEIEIVTEENEAADESVFFENYLLQISLAFDGDKTRNIKADKGMLANAGKDVQVTFTVMPEEEAELSVTADVEDFEFTGINIAAVPQNMAIDLPDTDEFTEEIKTLSDAMQELDAGVLELKNGTEELHRGTSALREGSRDYHEGIKALSEGSAELVDGSKKIATALETIHLSLKVPEMEELDISELNQITDGLSTLIAGLREVEGGMRGLEDGFSQAYKALDDAMNRIPTAQLSEEEIGELYYSGANQETVAKLLAYYEYALTVKGTYDYVKEAFSAVETNLPVMADALAEMADGIEGQIQGFAALPDMFDFTELTDGISELQQGISQLSSNYDAFHSGLVEYTAGVDRLASGYAALDSGIAELEGGTEELADGVGELREGTRKLATATEDLPDQVTEEIDDMLTRYDKSDFTPVSFMSEKNNDFIRSVQFVLKTEPIEMEEVEEEVIEEEEPKSFWERFLDLFRK